MNNNQFNNPVFFKTNSEQQPLRKGVEIMAPSDVGLSNDMPFNVTLQKPNLNNIGYVNENLLTINSKKSKPFETMSMYSRATTQIVDERSIEERKKEFFNIYKKLTVKSKEELK